MQPKTTGYLAFAFISIIWGTTYLVTRIGVTHYPPFLFTGIRQLMAGIILFLILKALKLPFTWSWKAIYPQLIAGVLVIGLGNGLTSWGVKFIPSGLSALLCTLIPMNITLISLGVEKMHKVNKFIILGLLAGLTGMAFIFRDNIGDLGRPEYLAGILITVLATICWSAGSVYSKTAQAPFYPLYKAAIQMVMGGILLLGMSAGTEKWETVSWPGTEATYALIYLTLIGSVAAFAAYQYALQVLPSGLVGSYAYINPIIAVVLGYFFMNERFTWYTVVAFLLTVGGVYLVNKGYKQQGRNNEPVSPANNARPLVTEQASA